MNNHLFFYILGKTFNLKIKKYKKYKKVIDIRTYV